MARIWARLSAMLLVAALLLPTAGNACTIFVLTNGEDTLFFNNEDWSDPKSRIWFVPAPEGYHSCVYVGFDNLGAEGGMNTAGLAFDWVAGFMEKWEPPAGMLPLGGRSSERMLESCATVEEAIAFYRKYREPQFTRAKILVADRSGASAIIGASNGELEVQRANHSRGFGYGSATLRKLLQKETPPVLATGASILRACVQDGPYATKYSSVFDLKNGEIHLCLPGGAEAAAELKHGTGPGTPLLRDAPAQPHRRGRRQTAPEQHAPFSD